VSSVIVDSNNIGVLDPNTGSLPSERLLRISEDRSRGSFNKIWLKPFDFRWPRDLITRKRASIWPQISNRKIAQEVNYYAPCGKKLRSTNEVTEYLTTRRNLNLCRYNLSCSRDPSREALNLMKVTGSRVKTADAGLRC